VNPFFQDNVFHTFATWICFILVCHIPLGTAPPRSLSTATIPRGRKRGAKPTPTPLISCGGTLLAFQFLSKPKSSQPRFNGPDMIAIEFQGSTIGSDIDDCIAQGWY